MAQDFTSTGLIAQVRRRASMPTSQNLFTDADVLSVLNEEMQNRIVPWLVAVREDYLYAYSDTVLDGTTLAYDIPTLAIGLKIKGLSIYNSSGVQISDLPRLDINSLYDSKEGYYITGSKINFYPTALTAANTMRIHYYRRPSDIVKATSSGLITTVTPTTITVSSIPSAWVTGDSFDFISSAVPYNVLVQATSSDITGSVITIADTTGISVGDYVNLTNESIYPQLPIELIPLLCQATTLRILEYSGDPNGMQMALNTYNQMEKDNRVLLVPRSEGQPKKILNRNRISNFNWF